MSAKEHISLVRRGDTVLSGQGLQDRSTLTCKNQRRTTGSRSPHTRTQRAMDGADVLSRRGGGRLEVAGQTLVGGIWSSLRCGRTPEPGCFMGVLLMAAL